MLIRYGQPESWKVISQQIGRTKPSRAPKPENKRHKKNDGRPPDTSCELLGKKVGSTSQSRQVTKAPLSFPSYQWSNNSCWLDTSLELLFQTVMRDFSGFSVWFAGLHPEMSLKILHEMLELRTVISVDKGEKNPSIWLSEQWDNFREHLQRWKFSKTSSRFDSVFVSCYLLFLIINLPFYDL